MKEGRLEYRSDHYGYTVSFDNGEFFSEYTSFRDYHAAYAGVINELCAYYASKIRNIEEEGDE